MNPSVKPKRLFGNIRSKFKVFNDPIHGHIEMHPLCVSIIDMPQFQRLRYIKQLGGTYFVFPGASHNRFEHSLGVAHLAFTFLESLNSRQDLTRWKIDEKDILCVMIAGLCHDLGHGPFSHMFDTYFIPDVKPTEPQWKHEDASVNMFEYLIESNGLRDKFALAENENLIDKDITFIKELIRGAMVNSSKRWPFKGRDRTKGFLYEIIANKDTEIDVDKWDYFARDCHHLGISNNFDHNRVMKFARITDVDGKSTICFRDKQILDLHDMFHLRAMLYRRAYTHKVCKAVEIMISEALKKADAIIKYKGKSKALKISDTIKDMEAYTKLTDRVYHEILHSTTKNLEPARSILQRIEKRDLYICVDEGQPEPEKVITASEKEIEKEILRRRTHNKLRLKHLKIMILKFNYCKGKENPVERVKFYKKTHEDGEKVETVSYKKIRVSQMLPTKFQEQCIRIYCRDNKPDVIELAKEAFKQWCWDTKDVENPKDWTPPSQKSNKRKRKANSKSLVRKKVKVTRKGKQD